MLCPIALRYQDEASEPDCAAVFTGDTTLVQSIWKILRCRQLNASLVFTPALIATGENRRVLARTAQEAISRELQNFARLRQTPEREAISTISQALLPAQSAYASLFDPLPNQLLK